MYLTSSGGYSTSSGRTSIGCYHVVLGSARDFEEAEDAARSVDGGFVAWIEGEYQVRAGAYDTAEQAWAACSSLGGVDVRGTSTYAVNVVETGSARILFQFDGGKSLALGVMPDVTGERDVRTWFKGFKYPGGFRYERIGGGDLTVVNIVDMESYVRGVIPYEMNNAWPMEALKAQAVAARSYAWNKIQVQGHSADHFDICTAEHCQVYNGFGSDNTSYQANERTDRAVEETEGMYALYDGEPIEAYFSASHGGASESISNVWGSDQAKYPYLCGVTDPYEQLVADKNPYSSWSKSYTAAQLTQRLQSNGYGAGTSVASLELTYSQLGNVIQVRVNYTNGKSNTFTPKNNFGVRSLFGVSSIHFTVNGQGADSGTAVVPDLSGSSSGGLGTSGGSVRVNETGTLDTSERVYTITGDGDTRRADPEDLYVITGSGSVDSLDAAASSSAPAGPAVTTPVNKVVKVSAGTYTVQGAGNGHQLGMSQWGAYAMAEEGFSYDEIVEFYYPGTRVREYQ